MADIPTAREDFERIYDLPDPRPYFGALRPLDYRMPRVVCSFLQRNLSLCAVNVRLRPIRPRQ